MVVVEGGMIVGVEESSEGERVPGALVPGAVNAHSHTFQRAIRGRTEYRVLGREDFWTWRERMYQAVDALDAARLHDGALALYRELRQRGYTSVAEFHYVHRPGGSGAFETSLALVEAAAAAGLRLLLLPVLYRRGGLDGTPLSARQQPFGMALDDYGRLLQALAAHRPNAPHLALAGFPVLGDAKYGQAAPGVHTHQLHARRITLPDGLSVASGPGDEFLRVLAALRRDRRA